MTGSSSNTSNTSGNASASPTAGISCPSGDDVTNTNAEMIATSQEQKTGDNGSKKVEKASCRKRKKTKGEMTGELLDKMINMQETSDKMFMELEMKRAKLEEKQMEMDMQIQREEREYRLQVLNLFSRNNHGALPSGAPSYPMYGYDGYDPDATQDYL